jgi:hypothetical protein
LKSTGVKETSSGCEKDQGLKKANQRNNSYHKKESFDNVTNVLSERKFAQKNDSYNEFLPQGYESSSKLDSKRRNVK